MSNYNWSLRYPVSSIKLKEDKLAKPFYHEEEEEGVEQFIKDGALKQKRESYPCHMSNYHWSFRYLIPSKKKKQFIKMGF
jgi:hypothetical protein